MQTLEFRIDATKTATRELGPTSVTKAPKEGNAQFFLPTWTPGSYLLREYSRHLSRVEAFEAGTDRQLPCRKVSKNRFEVEPSGAASIELRYRVYAHELTVRTADVDASHAYAKAEWARQGKPMYPNATQIAAQKAASLLREETLAFNGTALSFDLPAFGLAAINFLLAAPER